MNLIPVNKDELAVGEPLPWPLYDQMHNLLLAKGEIVSDEKHRDTLLSNGACHELSLKIHDIKESANNKNPQGEKEANKTGHCFTFDDMRLRAEDKLQLEPPAQLASERFVVRVIGYLRGASLLVTMPITANGLRLQLREKEKIVMRFFSGQNAFGFTCTILRIIKIPYEYLHLSFPDTIQGVAIRKAPRIKSSIIATAHNNDSKNATETTPALISDISANGVSLETKQPLGNKGNTISLSFRVHLHNIDAQLSVKGIIRAELNKDADNNMKPGIFRYGIEFLDLQPNDQVILQSMIYQQMIENPQKLV